MFVENCSVECIHREVPRGKVSADEVRRKVCTGKCPPESVRRNVSARKGLPQSVRGQLSLEYVRRKLFVERCPLKLPAQQCLCNSVRATAPAQKSPHRSVRDEKSAEKSVEVSTQKCAQERLRKVAIGMCPQRVLAESVCVSGRREVFVGSVRRKDVRRKASAGNVERKRPQEVCAGSVCAE